MGCKKQGAKNRVNVIQKEKRSGCLFSFWITMTLLFAPCFLQPIFWTFFFKFHNLKNIRSNWHFRIGGADWLGEHMKPHNPKTWTMLCRGTTRGCESFLDADLTPLNWPYKRSSVHVHSCLLLLDYLFCQVLFCYFATYWSWARQFLPIKIDQGAKN